MKPIIAALFFIFLFSIVCVKAQQTHFIYIQTSDKQPFYIKWDKNIYSSSYSGYLIISKLPDSTYNFSVGFPKSEWPQQNFSCIVNGKDKGYLLKNFGDKGWGLFDYQSMEVTMAGTQPVVNKNIVQEERTDSFSNMLSAVVNDPGIKMTEKVKPEIKTDTVQPVQSTEATVAEAPTKIETVNAPTIEAADNRPTGKSTIVKLLDKANADGRQLVYLDDYAGKQDTIRVFIPADKVAVVVQQNVDTEKIEDKPVPEPVKQQPKAEDKKFINIETPVPNSNADTTIKTQPNSNTQNIVSTNTGCKNFATEEEFLRLRKKMASEDDDDNMVSMANKVFKTKCFTTSQIKNLGFLFLDDKGRYKFFDMAYAFVSDSENYSTLQNQLSDPYFVNRFKALINH